MPNAAEILVIEDDRELMEVLDTRLGREGFRVRKAFDGKAGLDSVHAQAPSLILLDLMLPEMLGMDVCKRLKEDRETKNIPIIMLTANADEVDVVLGLELGADDYITKPFNLRQLIARIRAVLRRSHMEGCGEIPSMVTLGPVEIDRDGREVRVHKQPVQLTESEFQIFLVLAARAGQVVSRNELLQAISKSDANLVERNIDVHVGSLRRKLGPLGKLIVTVRSLGYKCMRAELIEI